MLNNLFYTGRIIPAILMVLMLYACRNGDQALITEKIVYDVQIKNTDSQVDWWMDNLPGPARDDLVAHLFDEVRSGKVAAWTETGKRMTAEEIRNIGREEVKVQLPDPEPPYTLRDTLIVQELNMRDITRIRFLESWTYDRSGGLIRKEVKGMAPVLENYGPDGELRGFQALFWVYKDGWQPAAK